MSKAVFVIKADGSIVKTEQSKRPTLDQLQTAVGGYIETVPHFSKFEYDGKKYSRGTAFCNEDGISKQLPFNLKATEAWLTNLGPGPFRYEPRLLGDVVYYASGGKNA